MVPRLREFAPCKPEGVRRRDSRNPGITLFPSPVYKLSIIFSDSVLGNLTRNNANRKGSCAVKSRREGGRWRECRTKSNENVFQTQFLKGRGIRYRIAGTHAIRFRIKWQVGAWKRGSGGRAISKVDLLIIWLS